MNEIKETDEWTLGYDGKSYLIMMEDKKGNRLLSKRELVELLAGNIEKAIKSGEIVIEHNQKVPSSINGRK